MKHLLHLSNWQIPLVGSLLIFGTIAHQSQPALSKHDRIQRIYTYLVSDTNNIQDTLLSANENSTTVFSPHDYSAIPQSLRTWIDSRQANTSADFSQNLETGEIDKSVSLDSYKSTTKTSAIKGNLPQQDGVYLYGQSSQPNQLGQGYIVLEKRQSTMIGALYVPQSEFSCFQGTVNSSGDLAMTVQSSPGGISPAQLATVSTKPSLPKDRVITYAHSVALTDYHQINAVTVNDHRMLHSCKVYR